jgi:hypothetical protein
MRKQSLFALAIGALLVIGGVAHAREAGLVGVVTNVEPNQLEIRTDSQEAVTVALTADTTYLKWIMAKPWQQDVRTDARALQLGRRVHVDVSVGARPAAQTVWVVTGRPGFE